MNESDLQGTWVRLRRRLALARLVALFVGLPLLLVGLAQMPALAYAGGIILILSYLALVVLNRCPACHRPLHEGVTVRGGNILRNPPACPHCGLVLP
jgi:hypothetical protein